MRQTAGVRLLLIADTHVPRRTRTLPTEVWAEVERADIVVHAGDWVVPQLLDELEERAALVLGVHGNNDGPQLRERLPEVATAVLGGVRVAVVHESGPRSGREKRMRARFPDTDLLVFGHSHIPWDSTVDGMRLLNPGSPTDRRRQPHCTYLTLTASHAALGDIVLHRISPPRLSRFALLTMGSDGAPNPMEGEVP